MTTTPPKETPVSLNEATRTYIFPNSQSVTFVNVRELLTRPSGIHRLKTADGKLHVVASGWLAITIEDPSHEWTV